MGTDDRPPNGALIQRLLQAPQRFDLFQAISLLERAAPEAVAVGEGDGSRPEAVRLRALISLGFPPSDVVSVKEDPPTGERFALTSPVLALGGASGPLPLAFTEELLARQAARDHATADFLDIFHHRFLSFLYRSRRKHRIGLDWQSPDASTLADMLDFVSALGVKRDGGGGAWLRHAGLLGGAPRSMSGLLQLLRDRLGLPVQGRQFVGGWRALEPAAVPRVSASAGSQAARLGRNTVLGRRVWDQGAGVALTFRVPRERMEPMLPGGPDHALAARLVRRYVQQDIDVTFTLKPVPGPRDLSMLGRAHPMRLGWTSWLHTGAATPRPVRTGFRMATAPTTATS